MLHVWTDGSANSGGSGWSVICPSRRLIVKGRLNNGTNQQAELSGVIQAVHQFGHNIVIHTDSKYAIGCFTEWLANWQRNGWKNAKKKPVENQPFIKLGVSLNAHMAKYEHIKGHSGDMFNEMADYYADAQIITLSPMHSGWQIIAS